MIDGVQTLIDQVKGNVAKGWIINGDLTKTETWIAKGNGIFAHGKTLKEAYMDLHEKMYDDSTEEERLEAFREEFKDYDVKVKAEVLFRWHHILTGSCRQGREAFCRDKGIDIDKDEYTVREFVELTKEAYGGETIKKLIEDEEA